MITDREKSLQDPLLVEPSNYDEKRKSSIPPGFEFRSLPDSLHIVDRSDTTFVGRWRGRTQPTGIISTLV